MQMINQIFNEDCLDGIKKIPDKSISCIICDPPYFTGMTHGYGDKAQMLDLAVCKPFYKELFREFKRVMNYRASLYWFCDWRSQGFYLTAMLEENIPVKNCLVWHKGAAQGNFYTYSHEMILFATNDNKFHKKGLTNVILGIPGFCQNCRLDGGKVHTSQKPLGIIEKLMRDGSEEGDTVLDCFLGSGTTAVAAINLNRRYIGFELSEKYFEIARRRIEEAQKNKQSAEVGLLF